MTSAGPDSPSLPPRLRPTARLIVLDEADRVLLFQVEEHDIFDPLDPRGVDRPAIAWCTPGGGVEPGETHEAAARRELREETGLSVEHLGPCIHDEENLLYFAQTPFLLQQHYFLVRVTDGAISLDGLNAAERASMLGYRWWSLPELAATVELVFPVTLAAIVRRAIDIG